MSRHPGAEFIPAAFLLPSWFIAPHVALIEQACNAWEDEVDLPSNRDEASPVSRPSTREDVSIFADGYRAIALDRPR